MHSLCTNLLKKKIKNNRVSLEGQELNSKIVSEFQPVQRGSWHEDRKPMIIQKKKIKVGECNLIHADAFKIRDDF